MKLVCEALQIALAYGPLERESGSLRVPSLKPEIQWVEVSESSEFT